MQEMRSDSEDDLDNSLSTASLSPSKTRRYGDHSSDDETYDRIQKRSQRNERNNGSNERNQPPPQSRERESNVRSNVRKGPNNRGGGFNNDSNQARAMPSKGFVPKDLSNNNNNNNRNSQNRRDQDEDMSENANWGKVPRRFLENDSSPGSKENCAVATARPYVPADSHQTSYNNNGGNSNDSNNWSRSNSARNNQMESVLADAVSEDDDDRSVESSATVEDFSAPTPPAKNRGDAPSKYSQLLEQQNERKRQQQREQEEQANKAKEEASLLRGNKALINNSPSRKFHNQSPARMENNAIEGSFKKYVEKTEALGQQLPRKSGRYGGGDEEEEQGGVMQVEQADYDEDEQGGGSGGSGRVDVSEEYSRDNWLLPSNKAATQSYKNSNGFLNSSKYSNAAISGGSSIKSSYSTAKSFSFALIAHPRGLRTEHVQCTIRRDRTSIQGKLYPSYELILEDPRKTLIVARKMNLNRTSNYHLFDMTRGQAGSKFSKKNGNYLGKLRAKNANRTEYVLLNQSSEREEVAGVIFERLSLMGQMSQGVQPRKMKILLPQLDEFGVPVPHRSSESGDSSLSEKLIILDDCERTGNPPPAHIEAENFKLFQSKDPVFENGNYRLNFNGRVSMPSVKNYQLVSPQDINNIICQFGKVDEDEFHLDYKAPLNAFQAFAFALCQFNL